MPRPLPPVRIRQVGQAGGAGAVITDRSERQLEQLVNEIEKDVLEKTFPDIAREYERRAPRDTGELAEGLEHTATVTSRPGLRVWRLWTLVPHSTFIEFGVATRGVQGEPVIREAFRKKRRTFGTRVRKLLRRYFPPPGAAR